MSPVAGFRDRWRRLLESPAEVARRYPSLAGGMADPTQRRTLLKLMAASMAMGGLSGCGDPSEPDGHWVPAVIQPPGIAPGVPNHYSTAQTIDGNAIGLVVEHRMGRPVKIEGNANHPSSLGATDAFAQALLLDFYDPDRASGVQHRNEPADLSGLQNALIQARERLDATHGAGLRIVTPTIASPTLGAMLDAVLVRWPEARWVQWDPASRDSVQAGTLLAYGQDAAIVPHADQADVVLALDSDLLDTAPGHVRHARDLMARRNPTRGAMSRIYAIEPTPTLIGTIADHRIPSSPADLHAALQALAAALLQGEPISGPAWLQPVADDLRAAPGKALVHAGPALPPEAQALVHAINERLGGRGATFDVIAPPLHRPGVQAPAIAELLADMQAGRVETLLVIDSNPAFTLPGFADAMGRVATSIHSAAAPDETAVLATWHVPATHLFENWGDTTAHDGTASVTQPQALPLYGGISPLTLLRGLVGAPDAAPQDLVKATWHERLPDDDAWFDALSSGVVAGTASPRLDVSLKSPSAAKPASQPAVPCPSRSCSVRTSTCMTAGLPIIPGSRNCRAR